MNEYFLALQRLIDGRPLRIGKGSEITRKNVALEAGKDASAIKAGREVFVNLIRDIELAQSKQKAASHASSEKMKLLKESLERSKAQNARLEADLEQSRKQCLMLMQELFVRKKEEYRPQSVKPDISPSGRKC